MTNHVSNEVLWLSTLLTSIIFLFCSDTRGKLCRTFTHELDTKKREAKHRNINASKTQYKQDT